jgi:hypothetical protein
MGPRVVGACCGLVVVRAQARVPVPLEARCVGLHVLVSPELAKQEAMARKNF